MLPPFKLNKNHKNYVAHLINFSTPVSRGWISSSHTCIPGFVCSFFSELGKATQK